ncbi:hypothetical protein [Zoogloea sp. LCSB751]|uniref:hypothetical protein n=1 Tax=Zoogloea sp. LCSB751 TaxID=1965277 RepID=UPI001117657B|nr:hypothetical protein [Zoogloea sp. LCSB751]
MAPEVSQWGYGIPVWPAWLWVESLASVTRQQRLEVLEDPEIALRTLEPLSKGHQDSITTNFRQKLPIMYLFYLQNSPSYKKMSKQAEEKDHAASVHPAELPVI